jgi:hypothetical protein
MKEYKINVIKEYVSTALISEDPEEELVSLVFTLINRLEQEAQDAVLEYLYHEERRLPVHHKGVK